MDVALVISARTGFFANSLRFFTRSLETYEVVEIFSVGTYGLGGHESQVIQIFVVGDLGKFTDQVIQLLQIVEQFYSPATVEISRLYEPNV